MRICKVFSLYRESIFKFQSSKGYIKRLDCAKVSKSTHKMECQVLGRCHRLERPYIRTRKRCCATCMGAQRHTIMGDFIFMCRWIRCRLYRYWHRSVEWRRQSRVSPTLIACLKNSKTCVKTFTCAYWSTRTI